MKRILAAAIGFVGLTVSAGAQTPVALVEDLQGKVAGVEFMDYVVPGKVIELGADGKLVLGYMKSCRRETITGSGTVTVGAEQSAVRLADLKAGKVPCDSSQAQRIGSELGQSAATVVRSIKEKSPPLLTLHGLSPIIETPETGKLIVERVDVKGERYEIDLTPATRMHGRFYDLLNVHATLQPGGTYSATINSTRTFFLIDASAEPGAGPIIGRLVRLR